MWGNTIFTYTPVDGAKPKHVDRPPPPSAWLLHSSSTSSSMVIWTSENKVSNIFLRYISPEDGFFILRGSYHADACSGCYGASTLPVLLQRLSRQMMSPAQNGSVCIWIYWLRLCAVGRSEEAFIHPHSCNWWDKLFLPASKPYAKLR